MKDADLIVQFSMLWGMEIGSALPAEQKKVETMKQYDSVELLNMFKDWVDEYLNRSDIEDSVDFFNKKLHDLFVGNDDEILVVLLDALIVGAGGFRVKHGSIAPYSTGYYVSSSLCKGYCQPVTCQSNWKEELPKRLLNHLRNQIGWLKSDFDSLKEQVEAAWAELPSDYDSTKHAKDPKSYYNYVANGYETDGLNNIINHQCHGTYSNYTTVLQNDLAEELVVLRGYCADYALANRMPGPNGALTVDMLSSIYERHGIDSDLSDADAWAQRNPTRCYSESIHYTGR